jgi:hypothetical protein
LGQHAGVSLSRSLLVEHGRVVEHIAQHLGHCSALSTPHATITISTTISEQRKAWGGT